MSKLAERLKEIPLYFLCLNVHFVFWELSQNILILVFFAYRLVIFDIYFFYILIKWFVSGSFWRWLIHFFV